MIFEYDYYPEGYMPEGNRPDLVNKTLEESLNVNYDVDYIRMVIDFSVSKYIPAKLTGHPDSWYEAEGGELSIESIYPMYLTTKYDDIPVTIHKREREIIGDYIDEKVIEKECWRVYGHEHE